jgi:hypothetical protein
VLPAALIALLLAAMLLPLAPTAGAEDNEDDNTPILLQGEDRDIDVLPEAQATKTPEASDDSGDGDAPLPDLDPLDNRPIVEDESSYVSIFKYLCPEDANLYAADHAALQAACAEPMPNIEFTHYAVDASDVGVSETKLTEIDGSVYFVQESPGSATLAETIVGGFGEPIVYCSKVVGAGSPLGQTYDYYQTIDGYLTTELLAGDQLVCDWYNVPVPTGTVRVIVIKYACPSEFDAYSADRAALVTNCTEYQDGVPYSVSDGGSINETALTGNLDAGVADFTGLDNGEYVVSEDVPDGYGLPVVWCGVGAGTQPNPADFIEYELYDDSAAIFQVLTGDDVLQCDWYNVPAEDPADIYITKYLCEDYLTPESVDWAALIQACPAGGSGWTFGLNDGDAQVESMATDQAGMVTFNAGPGTYSIVEDVPTGYVAPIVYCTIKAQPGDPVNWVSYEIFDANQIQAVLAEGESLICNWFNIPAEAGSGIYVTKHVCPVDFEAYASEWDGLIQNCPAATTEWEFSVVDGASYADTQVTGAGGIAAFQIPGAGIYGIGETIQDGFGAPRVFCTVKQGSGDPVDWVEQEVFQDYTINHLLNEGESLFCDWFNIPAEDETDGSMLIRKFACPDDYDAYNATHFDLASACPDAQNGVTFLLNDGDQLTLSGVTGDAGDGAVEFANLPTPGAYAIVEQKPDGYGDPVVYCKDPIDPNGDWAKSTVSDGNQILEILEAGRVLMCDWFNVPSEANTDDGDVTVIKYDCPAYPGFDPYLAELAQLEAECATLANGVQFDLYQVSLDQTDSRVTGDGVEDGVAFWDNVGSGGVFLAEHLPAGYGTPVVWCDTYDPEAQDQPNFNRYEDVELEVAAYLDPGQSLMCLWFNVPAETDGEIEVVKYWCDADVYDYSECELYTEGQPFTLVREGDETNPIEFETGPDGSYATTLPAGLWTLVEGDGGWCYAESNRQYQPQPLPNPGFDGTTLLVEVEAGEETVIEVYNCDPWAQDEPDYPDDDDDLTGTPVVIALPDTGAGVTVGTSGLGGLAAAAEAGLALLIVTVALHRSRRRR